MSVRKVRACSTLSAMNPEQDSIDSLIRQAIRKESFLSLSRSGDSPVQLIQLLHAFDQQGSDKVPKSSKEGSFDEFKENSDNIFYGFNSFSSEPNGIKDPIHSLTGYESNTKGSKCTPSQMPSRKIPEAVVAFAQAAAKVTGEPEKSNLPGWPFLSSKTPLQKCDKCSLEFCSSINYRRHRRVHRRSLNVDKDSQKNRDLLGTFWDKLSVDEAKELVSLRNVKVEEVTGSSVTQALSTWFRRAGVLSSLPQGYIKAGLKLLDVQASPSMSPISSQELFSVLDEASEKTFLCAGTALSLQKYVFDREAVKKALEIKNIVACASFLIEIELVKAWLVDREAEALRCQKLLLDEEEAAQKRQAKLRERKRLKKLRQKEQKMIETSNGEKIDLKVPSLASPPDRIGSIEASSPTDSSVTSEASHNHEHQLVDFVDSSATENDRNSDKSRSNESHKEYQNISYCEKSYADDHEQYVVRRAQGTCHSKPNHFQHVSSRPTQNHPNGFQTGQVSAARSPVNLRHSNSRDTRPTQNLSRPTGRKVWTIKSRPMKEEDGKEMTDREVTCQPVVSERNEVLIGSINVSLGDGGLQNPKTILESKRQENLVKPENDRNSDKSGSNESHKEYQNISYCEKSYADDHEQYVVRRTRGTGHSKPNHFQHVPSRPTQNNPNGFQAGQVSAARSSVNMRHSNSRDTRPTQNLSRPNCRKVWTIKSRPKKEDDGKDGKQMTDREVTCQPVVSERNEVLIGSINVSLGDGGLQNSNTILESKRQENLVKPDSSLTIQNEHSDAKPLIPANKDAERLPPERCCLAFEGIVSHFEKSGGTMMFSTEVAKAFLDQRWKEAIAGDHVLVISSPETEASGGPNPLEGNSTNSASQSSDINGRHILGRVENRLAGAGVGVIDRKFRPKS